ncbi:Gfo/Idh/MocA family oxidoreductase [Motilimonas sp. 1_MG-2023]|uniref:Gfo/Idh/MocA family protein n=1 Tax=Motilimonas sp. 1_MG-2023 TaxID=3062672 RepID=UPI0026E3B4E3|nr:Gfo/Idh/MocA family oxidoreductase [Motilimonas sp. 1_MG-2023]MDO6527884.1 Gfo/Idh/MocA family oxidoreductase [Motilimonas sp. 1_MG-2023]
MTNIQWGIIGTGNIAHQFASALQQLDGTTLLTVTSRQHSSAKKFADEFAIAHPFDTLDAMLALPELDVVYIATPHPQHFAQAKACLLAGKSVLCEKPMTLNKKQAEELVVLARQQGLFLMEAMLIPLFPAIAELKHLIEQGTLGEVRGIQASMGFNAPRDWSSRIFNPELAGGALLDIGIYPLTFAYMITQSAPLSMQSQVEKAVTGVDLQSSIALNYDSGIIANLSCSVGHYLPCTACVFGDKTWAEVVNFSFGPSQVIIRDQMGEQLEVINCTTERSSYYLEAKHVNECLRAGLQESPLVPHQQTLAVLEMMDTLRAQWQLTYPDE